MVSDKSSMEDPMCNSSFGRMVTLDYVTPDTLALGWKTPRIVLHIREGQLSLTFFGRGRGGVTNLFFFEEGSNRMVTKTPTFSLSICCWVGGRGQCQNRLVCVCVCGRGGSGVSHDNQRAQTCTFEGPGA